MKRVLALSLALAFLGASCLSGSRRFDGSWRKIEIEAPSDHMVWQLSLLSLQNMGFPLASDTDPGAGEVRTGWKTDLQPFRGAGRRWRAEMRLAPIEAGRWKVEARVERQRNDNLVTPLDASRADWKADGSDEQTAQVLLMHVQSRLGPEMPFEPASESSGGRKKSGSARPPQR